MNDIKIFYLDRDVADVFSGLMPSAVKNAIDQGTFAIGAIAEDGEKPQAAGVLTGHIDPPEMVLDWLFVAPEYRRRGIAARLVDTVAATAVKQVQLEGIVTQFSGEHEGMDAFLEEFGFLNYEMEGMCQYRSRISELSLPEKKTDKEGTTVPLSEVPARAWKQLTIEVNDAGKTEKPISCGVPLPILPEDYLPESRAIVEDGRISALILLERDGDAINVAWLYGDSGKPMLLLRVLGDAADQVRSAYGEDIELVFGTLNEQSSRLAERLMPDAEVSPLYSSFYIFSEEI
ncbi:MAG: GNAT family N-acetyltransferase [Lachnospiraceae bacterium]|nr:GNAT family N-acetyltransferase [Lachnospiraceae bacterium]